jgi:hypothetical protein
LLPQEDLIAVSLAVHGIDWRVVFAYFDETLGGAGDELTAVAGYLFDRDGVARFLSAYRSRVESLLPSDRHGRKMFHAAPCFDGRPVLRHATPYSRVHSWADG